MLQNLLIRMLCWLTDRAYKIQYIKIDKKAVEQWLYDSHQSKGFENYFKLEDLKILKTLGSGLDREKYLILLGRRLQLLYLYDDMRKSFELRKAREDKEKAENAKKQQNN